MLFIKALSANMVPDNVEASVPAAKASKAGSSSGRRRRGVGENDHGGDAVIGGGGGGGGGEVGGNEGRAGLVSSAHAGADEEWRSGRGKRNGEEETYDGRMCWGKGAFLLSNDIFLTQLHSQSAAYLSRILHFGQVNAESTPQTVARSITGAAMPSARNGFPVYIFSKYDKNSNTAIKGVVSAQHILQERHDITIGFKPTFRANRNELTLKVEKVTHAPHLADPSILEVAQQLSVASSTDPKVGRIDIITPGSFVD